MRDAALRLEAACCDAANARAMRWLERWREMRARVRELEKELEEETRK